MMFLAEFARKKIFYLVIIIFSMLSVSPVSVKARILPPPASEEMIKDAELIATGMVIKRVDEWQDKGELKTATIELEKILKGDTNDKDIVFSIFRERRVIFDIQVERLPPIGTKVFMVLEHNPYEKNEWKLKSAANSMAIMENNKIVSIYDIYAAAERESDYIAYYDAYYQANKDQAKIVDQSTAKSTSSFSANGYIILFILTAGIYILLVYVVPRWRKNVRKRKDTP